MAIQCYLQRVYSSGAWGPKWTRTVFQAHNWSFCFVSRSQTGDDEYYIAEQRKASGINDPCLIVIGQSVHVAAEGRVIYTFNEQDGQALHTPMIDGILAMLALYTISNRPFCTAGRGALNCLQVRLKCNVSALYMHFRCLIVEKWHPTLD